MANGRANRGARLGAGAAWAEARALGGKARFPCGFERQVAPRLARAVDYGGNAQGPVLRRRGRVGNPPPPNRRGRASQGKGLRQPQALRTGAGFHPLTPGGPFPLMVLRAPSDREALGRPGMPQQALASADWADIAPAGGVVKALWQREPMPLEATPGERVPSIQRSPHRVQSLVTATRPLTVHVAVPPSAYPLAFPGAWAVRPSLRLPAYGGPLLPLGRWRVQGGERGEEVTPFLGVVCRCTEARTVCRETSGCHLEHAKQCPAFLRARLGPSRYPTSACAPSRRFRSAFVSLSLCHGARRASRGGPSYRLSRPLHDFDRQSPPWGLCITRHLAERKATSPTPKLARPVVSTPHPWSVDHFEGTDRCFPLCTVVPTPWWVVAPTTTMATP
jgi:hypothetical protein